MPEKRKVAPRTPARKRNARAEPIEARRPDGKLVTFYSYKGGTGRSMALANVGWILATNGYRVLMIDWDLEAPGLHRYFRPFLADSELVETPGLIDFFWEFAEAARLAKTNQILPEGPEAWYLPFTDLSRHCCAVNYDFPNGDSLEFQGDGALHLVPAGRQGPGYAVRTGSFDWNEFYEKLGGGSM